MFCLGWTGKNAKSDGPIRNSLIFYLWQIWAGVQIKLEPKYPQEGGILVKSGAYALNQEPMRCWQLSGSVFGS
jgi:hypothetical protein